MFVRMKKCPRCDITFHLEDRSRCLYCDTLLMTTTEEVRSAFDTSGLRRADQESEFYERMLKEKGERELARMSYLVGCYFRSRTFKFMYKFNRNNMKIGEKFPRFLVQPLNYTAFLQLPWLVINFIDSFLVRATYNGFCPRCKWKYHKPTDHTPHDPVECSYNQEYQQIVEDILNGRIMKSEQRHRRHAKKKREAGRPSAYDDLCARRVAFWAVLDVMSIWFSMLLLLLLLIWLMLPLFQGVVARIQV